MKTLPRIASLIICLCSVTHVLRAQVPPLINYQGRVVVGTANFDGSGQFKFALVNAAGTTTYWSNDGTSVNGSQPTAAVTLTVTKGLYSVLLGDTSIANMTVALPASVFTNPDVRLRVWFNDVTHGSQLLTPDQRLAAVGYAFMADNIKDGAITSAKLAPGAVTAASIANGSVGSAQIAPGALAPAQNIAGTTQLAQPNTQYAATSSSLTTMMLPLSANIGDVVQVAGQGSGGWAFDFSNGQQLITRWIPRENNRVWSSVACSADGIKLVAAAQNDQLYTSTDSGVSWTPRENTRDWRSVASSADGIKLVAAAQDDQLYTSTDSGVSWTPRENTRNWRSVASSADGIKLVAAAQNDRLYTSTDSGVSWTPRENTRFWQSVASSADGSKLVAAVLTGVLYTSTDSGVSWTPRENSRVWQSVASSANGIKLVAAAQNQQLYTSPDSGVSWVPRENTRNWRSVASSADGTKLVAAENGGQLYISNNSGVSWTPRDNPRNWLSLASSADGTKLVAAVDSGQIYTNLSSSFSGAQGSVAALRYLGNGLWAAIEESQVAAGAVGPAQLAVNSVQTGNIANGAVTNSQLGTSAVTTVNIAAAAVTNATLATDAVNTTNIVTGAVTNAKLATNAVNTTNIVTGAVTNAKLATSAVITTNILNGAVTSAKLDPSIPGGLWSSAGGHAYRGTGNVGIDTTSPQRPLQIGDGGVSGSLGMVRIASVSATGSAARTWEFGVPKSTINENDTTNQYYSFGIFDTGIGGAPQFMIQFGTGNVGIGTATPANRLDVQGAANFTGNVGIGTSSPQAQLEVKGSGTGNVLIGQWAPNPGYGFISLNNSNSNGGYSFMSQPGVNNDLLINRPTNGSIRFRQNNGTDQMVISPIGDLTISGEAYKPTGGSWITTSDVRVKKNIQSLSGSLEKLKALRPVSFEFTPAYRADHRGLEGTFTGFVAQEVEPVFPEMIRTVGEKVGSETLEDFHLLDVSGLLPHVVAGVQTLKAENEALRKRAAELEATHPASRSELAEAKPKRNNEEVFTMKPLSLALRFPFRPHNRSQTQSPATKGVSSKMNGLLRTGLVLLCLFLATSVQAGPRTSANYTIVTDTVDAGGVNAQSANYSLRGSAAGEFGTGSSAVSTSGSYNNKPGYVGQLSDLLMLAVSRLTHGGAGAFDINLPLSSGLAGVECRSSSIYTVVFTFANPLTSTPGVNATATGVIQPGPSSGSIDPNDSHNYIANLTSLPNAQYITATLSNVNDSDGNFSNSLPAVMGLLIGDTNGNRSVNASDVSLTKLRSGQAVDVTNFRTDVNLSSSINATDVSTVKSRSGSALP